MKDQHEKITGYRDLSEEEIMLMNEAKALAVNVGELVSKLEGAMEYENRNLIDPDGRWLAIAKTDLQKGFMALVRSIAKPTTF